MALGKRRQKQAAFWNEILDRTKFDRYAERICRKYYATTVGRPSIPPGVYFRCFLLGYFEGIDSERGIAYRVSDSLSLREFLGLSWEEQTPDHSTLSKTRRRMNLGTHQAVFRWVLKRLAAEGLVSGKNLGVDATTLEANAALKSIVRREDGASYDEHVTALMKTEGVEEPTPAQRQRFDRKRKKSLANRDWVNPHDREARITKMKDGRTHLAYKAEHAVDLETGAILALTVQPGDRGNTASLPATLAEAGYSVTELAGQAAQADGRPGGDGERSRRGAGGCGQGLPQQAGLAGSGRTGRGGCAHGDRRARAEAAKVVRTARGTNGGVCESAAAEHPDRQGADETARRTDRKKLRSPVRHRRHETGASARSRQHRQTRADSCGSLQSELDPAADVGGGHRPAGGRLSGHAVFCLSQAHPS